MNIEMNMHLQDHILTFAHLNLLEQLIYSPTLESLSLTQHSPSLFFLSLTYWKRNKFGILHLVCIRKNAK